MTDHRTLRIAAMRFKPTQGTGITFPMGIQPTKCKTRTNSSVYPNGQASRHGAVKYLTTTYYRHGAW